MSLALPMSEFLYGELYSFACALTGKKTCTGGWVAERSGKEIFVAVGRGQKRRRAGERICFRKCRCGSRAAPYEIISILRRGRYGIARSSGDAMAEGKLR